MSKSDRIPKRFGGVKVPKEVRRGLKRLPPARRKLVITDALTFAAASMAAHEQRLRLRAAVVRPRVKLEAVREPDGPDDTAA